MVQEFARINPFEIKIRPSFNPRSVFDIAELTESVRCNGIVVPLRVKRINDSYELIDGERRLRACSALLEQGVEIKTVPVILEKNNLNEADCLLTALITNQGEPLSPLDEAYAYRRLLRYGWTQVELSQRVGKSQGHVSNRLMLLEAEPEVLNGVSNGEIGITETLQAIRESKESDIPQIEIIENIQKEKKAKKEKKILSIEEQYQVDKEAVKKTLENVQLEDFIKILIEYADEECLEFLVEPFELALEKLNENIPSL